MLFTNCKKRILAAVLAFLMIAAVSVGSVHAEYIPTNRDTKLPPDKVSYDIVNTEEFEKIYETATLEYYFREDRDVIAVKDKRTGYTWKTGLDIPFANDIKNEAADAGSPEEAEKIAQPIEGNMNTTYTGIANSILTVEYNENGAVKNISSASKTGAESELVTLNDNPATRRLDVNFKSLEVKVKVYITFDEDSIHYEIKDEEITGKGVKDVVAFTITPFLGASGGTELYYNKETDMFDIEKKKELIPGYIMVPDGSGSLIRFQRNSAKFGMYFGDVYGEDPAQNQSQAAMLSDVIPMKNPVMPVFGVAHGDAQAAFVAYADKGAEYMQIVVRPEGNLTDYNYVYPRFVRNVNYFQVYNKKGAGYFTMMEEPNKSDISMTYTFLAGDGMDGTPAADYTGMARAYREHLLETGILTEAERGTGDIPIRLDFIMSDSKKGIVGTEEVVVTTTEDVRDILTTLTDKTGITNINSGLYGWQKGGETIASPGAKRYSGKIGSEKEFKKLFADFADKNIDISYARDYSTINSLMMKYQGNAARHVNSWYLTVDKEMLLPENSPVSTFAYATPEKSAQWLEKQLKRVGDYSLSMTVDGISNILLSTYDSDGIVNTVTETMEMYEDLFAKANQEVKLNLEAPNMYLWKYTDRYLQSPVGSSQYVFETDAVPFLQMVLDGTMEVYAPYANFSFYTQPDILKMIDYNLSPSFILSKEPSYHLASTPSCDLYSTEYAQYEKLIQDVYGKLNEVLSQVSGYEWIERTVLQNGVIRNAYRNGTELKYVVINYTEDTVSCGKTMIAPLSAQVLTEKEVQ